MNIENSDQNKKRRIDYNNRIYLHENFSLYAMALFYVSILKIFLKHVIDVINNQAIVYK